MYTTLGKRSYSDITGPERQPTFVKHYHSSLLPMHDYLLNPGTPLQTKSANLKVLIDFNEFVIEDLENTYHKRRFSSSTTISRHVLYSLQRIQKSPQDRFLGSYTATMHSKPDPNGTDLLAIDTVAENHRDYLVCAKTDGIRYLLFVCSNGLTYLNDRKSEFIEVRTDLSPCIPSNLEISEQPPKLEVLYVLDGELIINRDDAKDLENNPNGPIKVQYLVFDMIWDNQTSLAFLTFTERLKHAKTFLEKHRGSLPHTEEGSKDPQLVREPEGRVLVKCVLKDFYPAHQAGYLLQQIIEKEVLPHENDGLIFTKIDYPYLPGWNLGMVKWKPSELNTIDFLVAENPRYMDQENMSHVFEKGDFYPMELYTIYRDKLFFYDFLFLTMDEYIKIQSLFKKVHPQRDWFGAIMECVYDHKMEKPQMASFLELVYPGSSTDDLELIIENCVYPPIAKGRQAASEKSGGDSDSEDSSDEWRNRLLKAAPKNYLAGLYSCFESRTSSRGVGGWKTLRHRADKERPNSFDTADQSRRRIFEENISRDDIVEKFSPQTQQRPQKKLKTS